MQGWSVPDFSNVTATAILGWYAWHTASKTIPALLRDFREELAAKREESRRQLDDFRKELALERQLRHADNQAITATLHEISVRLASMGHAVGGGWGGGPLHGSAQAQDNQQRREER